MSTGRIDFDTLIPIEVSQEVIQRVAKVSAIETVARPETMTTDTKQISRMGGFQVSTIAKGADYVFSTDTQDQIDMIARKIGGAGKVAEEDLADTVTGEATMRRLEQEAGDALARNFDHACIGVTAASNGTTVPFQSIYNAITTAQSTPWGNYAASANLVQIPKLTGGVATDNKTWQDKVADWLALYEEGDWYAEGDTFLIASPAIKSIFRKVRDSMDNPVFVPDSRQGGSPSLFGYSDFRLTVGARTDATMTPTPTGNPLVIIGNRGAIRRGLARTAAGMVPGNPGVQWQRAGQGIGFLSDEAIMKAMMRRAFVVTVPQAIAVLEITPGA